MHFPQLLQVKDAASNRSSFDLSRQHITTSDFGVMGCSFCEQLNPNDHFSIKHSTFSRLAPLALPTFGRTDIESRAFFVPYRIVWAGFESFITGKPYDLNGVSHSITEVPYLTNAAMADIFADSAYGMSVLSSGTDFDFYMVDGSVTSPRKFTAKGRRFYTLLLSLGYSINFNSEDATKLNLLPLLCYFRVIADFYLNPRFDYLHVLEGNFRNYSSTQWTKTTITNFFNYCVKLYDSDYFNSSWQQLNQSGAGLNVSNSISVGDGSNPSHITSNSERAYISYSNGNPSPISSRALVLLQNLQRYITRNNIAGTRYIDQMLARFGVHLNDAIVQRSQYIGSSIQPVQISDIMTTANTELGKTGEYNGKGVSYGNGHYTYDAKEYGMIIVVSTIVPRSGYFQGRKRYTTYNSKFDFYTPEFDCMNMQAIRNDELFADFTDGRDFTNSHGGKPDGVFGYVPRYSEQRVAMDTLSGDFRIKTRNTGLNAFHLLRELDIPSADTPLSNNSNFGIITDSERKNYDRIFMAGNGDTDDTSYDHFYLIHDFEVHANRSMKSLSEAYEDEHEKGKEISIRPNGVKF